MRSAALGAFIILFGVAAVLAGPSSDEMNASNNPLQPAIGLNFQDYYTGSFYGLDDADANAFLLRGVVPHKLFGHPQIVRGTLPIVTSPDLGVPDSDTAIGDFNIFDIFLFKAGKVELGFGPQLTIPTATLDETGTGKWQAGAAALIMAPHKWGMVGGLLTWQTSFAGDDDRPDQDNLQIQPLFIYNLPKGWYFRSTALLTWDLERDTHYLPVGAGAGKIWKGSGIVWNAFVEPQWTVSHDGDGVPKLQIFTGLNLQFPVNKGGRP
ncbi:MAG TPA: hypothetical protein VJV75_10585 [Candidatus Polarisedimenticolia bacterium]|nr:hypothetical protein [Candidatus Polarisedimenticolia bacterium]